MDLLNSAFPKHSSEGDFGQRPPVAIDISESVYKRLVGELLYPLAAINGAQIVEIGPSASIDELVLRLKSSNDWHKGRTILLSAGKVTPLFIATLETALSSLNIKPFMRIYCTQSAACKEWLTDNGFTII